MCEEAISADDFERFEETLAKAVEEANALEELETWLKAQGCIDYVRLEDYLVKTFPPRREFVAGFKMQDGSVQEKVIDVTVLEDQGFQLSGIHDP